MQGDRHLALIYIRTAADGAGAEHLFGWELYLLRLRQNHRSGRWHHVMGLEERRHHRQKRQVGRFRRVVHLPEQPRFGQNGENHPRGREHRGVVYRNIHLEHVRCGDFGHRLAPGTHHVRVCLPPKRHERVHTHHQGLRNRHTG